MPRRYHSRHRPVLNEHRIGCLGAWNGVCLHLSMMKISLMPPLWIRRLIQFPLTMPHGLNVKQLQHSKTPRRRSNSTPTNFTTRMKIFCRLVTARHSNAHYVAAQCLPHTTPTSISRAIDTGWLWNDVHFLAS